MFLLIRENIINVNHIIGIVEDPYVGHRYKVFLTDKAEAIPLNKQERDLLIHALNVNHLLLPRPCVGEPESSECQQLHQEPLNYDNPFRTDTD